MFVELRRVSKDVYATLLGTWQSSSNMHCKDIELKRILADFFFTYGALDLLPAIKMSSVDMPAVERISRD